MAQPRLDGPHALRQWLSREHQVNEALRLSQAAGPRCAGGYARAELPSGEVGRAADVSCVRESQGHGCFLAAEQCASPEGVTDSALCAVLLLVTGIIAVLMILDDPLPYCRLRVEGFAVLVVDDLGGSPANLWPFLRTASLLGAVVPGHVLIGEAWQAQIKSAVS
jgi:hypothetical protein